MHRVVFLIALFLLFTGCTINGKTLSEMMEKKKVGEHKTALKELESSEDEVDSIEQKEKRSSFKFKIRWADKEKHEGAEEILTIGGEDNTTLK